MRWLPAWGGRRSTGHAEVAHFICEACERDFDNGTLNS